MVLKPVAFLVTLAQQYPLYVQDSAVVFLAQLEVNEVADVNAWSCLSSRKLAEATAKLRATKVAILNMVDLSC